MARLTKAKPFIHTDCEITESQLGTYTEIGKGSRVTHSVIGNYSYCDRFCDIANARIGKFSNVASFSRIGPTDHPLNTAACHHFLYRSDDYWDDADRDDAFFARRRSRLSHIGHDTWIGAGAIVKPGLTLGHGSVVAAGAVVTKDIAPYEIVAGTPAKKLRMRQPAPIAERLLSLAWWDWSHKALREALEDFRALSAEEFLEKYNG